MRLLLFLAATAVLAGCSSPAPAPVPEPSGPAGSLVALDSCFRGCFEPSVAVAGGTLFATAGSNGVYRGDPAGDGGFLWSNVTPPAPRMEGFRGPGDRIVDASPDGVLAVSEILVTDTGVRGVRLSMLDPGAPEWRQTGFSNAFLYTPSHDRQWVAFGPAGAVAVTYKDQNSGLYLHRSSDGGRTFDEGVLIAQQRLAPSGPGVPTLGLGIIAGPPLFTAQDVRIPLFYGGVLMVAEVAEGPSQVRPVLVGGKPVEGDFFPVLAQAPDGSFWMAMRWNGTDLGLLRSPDGEAWTPVAPPPHETLTASPWVRVSPSGAVHVAWTQGHGLMHAREEGSGWHVDAVGEFAVPEGLDRNTDFAHFALQGEAAWFAHAPGGGLVVVQV